MTKHVCIIGAGPSGLPAIKNLIEAGISVVAYDYNSDVGGNWIYNENESHSSVFETTHIISSKTLSQYEDFPFSQRFLIILHMKNLGTIFNPMPNTLVFTNILSSIRLLKAV